MTYFFKFAFVLFGFGLTTQSCLLTYAVSRRIYVDAAAQWSVLWQTLRHGQKFAVAMRNRRRSVPYISVRWAKMFLALDVAILLCFGILFIMADNSEISQMGTNVVIIVAFSIFTLSESSLWRLDVLKYFGKRPRPE